MGPGISRRDPALHYLENSLSENYLGQEDSDGGQSTLRRCSDMRPERPEAMTTGVTAALRLGALEERRDPLLGRRVRREE
jgi:hypothetical protein